jgi:phage terminase small subunit
LSELNPKQARFVKEYLIDLNATQAAIRAGYSKKTAVVQGSRLLSYAKIKDAVRQGQKRLSEKLEITQEKILSEYAKIAFFDPLTLFDEQGHLLDIKDVPKNSRAAIGSLDHSTQTNRKSDDETEYELIKKIKLWDKTKALEALSKHLGLFEKDNIQKNQLFDVINKLSKQSRQLILSAMGSDE